MSITKEVHINMRFAAIFRAMMIAVLPFATPLAAKTPYFDLTQDFEKIVDETKAMDEKLRVALFRQRMNTRFPGFYEPHEGVEAEGYDTRVAKALRSFPEIRSRYQRAQRDFPAAYSAGMRHFRKVFPGFKLDVPVYFVHSLGEMDGGAREIHGKVYMIFGADMIGRIHTSRDIGPFLDHELFHIENGKYFSQCEQLWCRLWAEGLATFAAKSMNPGADDQQLMLTYPKPIRPAVDAKLIEALCLTRAKFDSTAGDDHLAFFASGGEGQGAFPERFGYYVGLRAAEELGHQYGLQALAHMTTQEARSVLLASLDKLAVDAGGCR